MIDPNEKIKYVELVEYNAEWPRMFQDEQKEIQSILQENCVQIHHIGSTAIPHIYAKPIIDILPIVKNLTLVDALNKQFEALGYTCMGEYGISGRRYYWKSKEKRTHHIHLFEEGSPQIERHLLFKDFLIANPDFAQAYSLVKRNLAEVFPQDIENYLNGKSSFVQMIEFKAGIATGIQMSAQDNIVIEAYSFAWPKLFDAEMKTIKKIANQLPYEAIEHIGSTAVPGLSSKPIIDILITLDSIEEANQWIKPLETLGYVFWSENPDKSHLRFFKGMPPFGMRRTHHIHIVEANNHTAEQRILFRDILRQNEKIKLEYESLKLKLAQSFSKDREEYTDKKSEFIENTLRACGYLNPIVR